jgi:hypothetical protein
MFIFEEEITGIKRDLGKECGRRRVHISCKPASRGSVQLKVDAPAGVAFWELYRLTWKLISGRYWNFPSCLESQ